jgi:hypothetical protein
MSKSTAMRNPAQWLIDLIRSIPNSGESFGIVMERQAEGTEGSAFRAITGMYRAEGDVTKIVKAAFSPNSRQYARYMEWQAYLGQAREIALKNEPVHMFLSKANACLTSLEYCAAYIDDNLVEPTEGIEDASLILKELESFLSELSRHEKIESSLVQAKRGTRTQSKVKHAQVSTRPPLKQAVP